HASNPARRESQREEVSGRSKTPSTEGLSPNPELYSGQQLGYPGRARKSAVWSARLMPPKRPYRTFEPSTGDCSCAERMTGIVRRSVMSREGCFMANVRFVKG